ncbi:hypothetical protein STEG23_008830 [Scotinomys teguina]
MEKLHTRVTTLPLSSLQIPGYTPISLYQLFFMIFLKFEREPNLPNPIVGHSILVGMDPIRTQTRFTAPFLIKRHSFEVFFIQPLLSLTINLIKSTKSDCSAILKCSPPNNLAYHL